MTGKLIAAALAALLLGACDCRCVPPPTQAVAPKPTPALLRNRFYPTHSQTEYDTDKYRCRRENTHEPLDTRSGIAYIDENTVGLCLRAKGWVVVSS